MADLTREQLHNARIIVQAGREVGASSRDVMIALMAASVESDLRNVNYGDRDSLGLFQQRAAWGPRSVRMNPYESARMFFLGGRQGQPGLFDNPRRNRMDPGRAAQWVQRSAFPDRYAERENVARQVLGMPGSDLPSTSNTGGRFMRPVASGRITQRFGDPAPRGVTYKRGYKNGMSFAAGAGSPVMASARGRVVRVSSGGDYGNRVEVEHGGQIWTLYAHMASTNVQVGDTVEAGQVLGRVGSTGQTTGSHLHFELRQGKNNYYSAVNPQDFLDMKTTPRAYVQDVTMYMDPSEDPSTFGAEGPMSSMFATKPYVYTSPIESMKPVTPGVQRESLGGLLDSEDRLEYRLTPPEDEETELESNENDEETRIPEGVA